MPASVAGDWFPQHNRNFPHGKTFKTHPGAKECGGLCQACQANEMPWRQIVFGPLGPHASVCRGYQALWQSLLLTGVHSNRFQKPVSKLEWKLVSARPSLSFMDAARVAVDQHIVKTTILQESTENCWKKSVWSCKKTSSNSLDFRKRRNLCSRLRNHKDIFANHPIRCLPKKCIEIGTSSL